MPRLTRKQTALATELNELMSTLGLDVDGIEDELSPRSGAAHLKTLPTGQMQLRRKLRWVRIH